MNERKLNFRRREGKDGVGKGEIGELEMETEKLELKNR